MSLQTLQTEYTSLLQKLQREKIRTETIDKKATVVQAEVNGLTTRNEELSDQLKIIQQQLGDSDGKIDALQKEHAKEKSQWIRMLDMNTQMQAKSVAAKQEWAEEKSRLLAALAKTKQPQPAGRATDGPDHRSPFTPKTKELIELQARLTTTSHHADTLRHALLRIQRDSRENAKIARAVANHSDEVIGAAETALAATVKHHAATMLAVQKAEEGASSTMQETITDVAD